MKKTDEPLFCNNQVFVRSLHELCSNAEELTTSSIFKEALAMYLAYLREKDSPLMEIFNKSMNDDEQYDSAIELLQHLAVMDKSAVIEAAPHLACFFYDSYRLFQFAENFYNYWRRFERFLIYYCTGEELEAGQTPYVTFSETIEHLNHLVRSVHRDISRHISGRSPRVYRQVPAGCQVGLIVCKEEWPCPEKYSYLKEIHFIRQILLEPPLIIDPLMNKRAGSFK